MSKAENKLLVRRRFDEIWNAGNWATADELYAPEYVNHDPYNPDQGTGPEGFKQRVSGYRSVLHDFDLRIERQIAEGDMVETRWSLPGIHGGELEGTAPTGKSVYVDGQLLSRIVDGKFVEEWVHWDTVGLLRQIGAVPHPHRDQLVPPSGELDLAVRDLRDPVFGHHRPDLPAAGRRG